MKQPIRVITVLTVAALAALSLAQSVSLKRVAKEGDVAKYKMRAEVDIQGMSATVSLNMNEKILKIADNGDITTESSQTDLKVKLGDQDVDAPQNDAPQVTVSKATGEVVELKGDMVDGTAYRMAAMSSFYMPGKDVAVGDSWETKIAKNDKLGIVAATAKYKIEKTEKVGDFDAVQITFEYKETEGNEPASASGKIWISTKDGSMVKLDGEWKNAPFPGAPMPINAKVVIERA